LPCGRAPRVRSSGLVLGHYQRHGRFRDPRRVRLCGVRVPNGGRVRADDGGLTYAVRGAGNGLLLLRRRTIHGVELGVPPCQHPQWVQNATVEMKTRLYEPGHRIRWAPVCRTPADWVAGQKRAFTDLALDVGPGPGGWVRCGPKTPWLTMAGQAPAALTWRGRRSRGKAATVHVHCRATQHNSASQRRTMTGWLRCPSLGMGLDPKFVLHPGAGTG
jgi:hypothetical protein